MGRNSPFGSATPLKHKGDDIVYSPNKYRETEGIKVIKLKELSVSLCQKSGTTDTQ